jgi:mono/diheme cytochrome c family protein
LRAIPAVAVALALAGCCGEREAQRRAAPAPAGDPGLRVWTAQGCGACHTFAPARSTATIGPNLSHSLVGRTRDYIRESIVAPNARVPGGGRSIMPEGFGNRMTKRELDALVTFVARGGHAR